MGRFDINQEPSQCTHRNSTQFTQLNTTQHFFSVPTSPNFPLFNFSSSSTLLCLPKGGRPGRSPKVNVQTFEQARLEFNLFAWRIQHPPIFCLTAATEAENSFGNNSHIIPFFRLFIGLVFNTYRQLVQEELVEDFALDNLGQGWRQPDNIGLYIVLNTAKVHHIFVSQSFSLTIHIFKFMLVPTCSGVPASKNLGLHASTPTCKAKGILWRFFGQSYYLTAPLWHYCDNKFWPSYLLPNILLRLILNETSLHVIQNQIALDLYDKIRNQILFHPLRDKISLHLIRIVTLDHTFQKI